MALEKRIERQHRTRSECQNDEQMSLCARAKRTCNEACRRRQPRDHQRITAKPTRTPQDLADRPVRTPKGDVIRHEKPTGDDPFANRITAVHSKPEDCETG